MLTTYASPWPKTVQRKCQIDTYVDSPPSQWLINQKHNWPKHTFFKHSNLSQKHVQNIYKDSNAVSTWMEWQSTHKCYNKGGIVFAREASPSLMADYQCNENSKQVLHWQCCVRLVWYGNQNTTKAALFLSARLPPPWWQTINGSGAQSTRGVSGTSRHNAFWSVITSVIPPRSTNALCQKCLKLQ